MTTDNDPRTLPPERAMLYIPDCLWAVTRHVYDPYTDCQGEPDAPGLTLDELLLLEYTLVFHLDLDDGPVDEPPGTREDALRRLDEPYPGFFDFIGDLDGDTADAGLVRFEDWSRGINDLYGEHCSDPKA